MAVQSKFYQLTGQLLLEYKTDQYIITRNATGQQHFFMMYKGIDNNQYCILQDNVSHALYTDDDRFTQYYGGLNSNIEIESNNTQIPYGHDIYVADSSNFDTDFKIGKTVLDSSYDISNEWRSGQVYCDTIRLYILTGYVMNNIGGYSLKVKGKVIKVKGNIFEGSDDTIVKRIDDYLYLLNWYMPKEELKNNIHWLDSPLYLNSKFYDRYIEIKLPSAQDIAINNRNIDYVYIDEENRILRGTVDQYSNLIIEFATVQQDNIKLADETNSSGASSFILDTIKQMSIYPQSNANNFGVSLYEDVDTHSIIYYPTYGDGSKVEPLNLDVMALINNGEIPLINYSEYDSANDGMDDFIEMYADENGEIPCKWIIINELSVTYNYNNIILGGDDTEYSYTDFFTNTIDYSYKKLDDGEFYVSKFIPYIKEIVNKHCKSIVIQYNCHLFNRMNNIDIVRQASMTIKDPYRYTLTSINTGNIINYKIVNKIEKPELQAPVTTSGVQTTKIIKEYYDVTELLASTNETVGTFAQGKMTIKLNHSGTNTLIKLYTINADNTRVPYDLTGPWKYKLVFPTTNSGLLTIYPSMDNSNTNLLNGSLSFYISKENGAAIMSVPASERYFSLMTDNDETESSVIYEGRVDWKV